MADHDFQPISPARLEWPDDTPLATDFDDTYFSRGRGPAESDYVFLQGNGLAQRFRHLEQGGVFTIGETGFGTGLNFLLAAGLFLEEAPDDSRLHFLSVEKHPLTNADLKRARALEPVVPELAAELLARYPAATPGFHRFSLAGGRVTLTLMYGDAHAMLRLAEARVNAWLLDGFAPARNPQMWHPALFEQCARLSAPGASLATFTAAGFVRRGLVEAGFAMEKAPGFAGKRHMLRGRFPGTSATARLDRRPVAIVGAGLAGSTLARALAERGCPVTLFDAEGVAQGASGNHAGVVYTTPSAHPTPQNRFYQASYLHALQRLRWLDFPLEVSQGAMTGVMQLPPHDRGARKAREALQAGFWPETVMRRAGGTDQAPTLLFPGGGFISPPAWCRHLLDHPLIRLDQSRVTALAPAGAEWLCAAGGVEHAFPRVVLANAAGARGFHGLENLPLKTIRGQVTYCRATEASRDWRQAWCHQGYLTPAVDGLHCVGASFDLNGTSSDPTDQEDRENLESLRRNLPEHWRELGGESTMIAGRRVGFRCQSRDFLPLVGSVPGMADGLYLDIAHGSRGITSTPLCAEILASRLCNEPAPVDRDMLDALSPERFSRLLQSSPTPGD